jgi:hypothetical protein
MSGSTLDFSCVILPVYVYEKNKLGSFALAREGARIPLVGLILNPCAMPR